MRRFLTALATALALAAFALSAPVKAEEAKPIRLASAAILDAAAFAPAEPKIMAVINLSSQTMEVTITRADRTERHSWDVSTGKKGYRTPPGTFQPTWLNRMHYSKKYDNAPMPYSVFFNGGIAVHGTEYVKRLGSPASHGCVRLDTKNAKLFFAAVKEIGSGATTIIVRN